MKDEERLKKLIKYYWEELNSKDRSLIVSVALQAFKEKISQSQLQCLQQTHFPNPNKPSIQEMENKIRRLEKIVDFLEALGKLDMTLRAKQTGEDLAEQVFGKK